MELHPNIEVYQSTIDLVQNAAKRIILTINKGIRERGDCFIALSGGATPRPVYQLLGTPSMKDQVDWSRVHLFFADERIVPLTDTQSNYGMVNRELIAHIDIPRKNVHRIEVEKKPELAAAEYERELREIFSDVVRFDLILLGLGEDGHTASIFPKTAVVEEERAFACAVFVPHLSSWRVTLTFRSINNAREVLFLVSGKEKAPIVRRVLKSPKPRKEVPATMIRPVDGILLWMIDGDAAGEETHPNSA
jgi:6-phosphogluconolactonase